MFYVKHALRKSLFVYNLAIFKFKTHIAFTPQLQHEISAQAKNQFSLGW